MGAALNRAILEPTGQAGSLCGVPAFVLAVGGVCTLACLGLIAVTSPSLRQPSGEFLRLPR